MTTTLRFTAIGDGLGIVLPSDLIERLQASNGMEVKVIDTPDGIFLQRVDSKTEQQIEIAANVMDRREDALRRLAE